MPAKPTSSTANWCCACVKNRAESGVVTSVPGRGSAPGTPVRPTSTPVRPTSTPVRPTSTPVRPAAKAAPAPSLASLKRAAGRALALSRLRRLKDPAPIRPEAVNSPVKSPPQASPGRLTSQPQPPRSDPAPPSPSSPYTPVIDALRYARAISAGHALSHLSSSLHPNHFTRPLPPPQPPLTDTTKSPYQAFIAGLKSVAKSLGGTGGAAVSAPVVADDSVITPRGGAAPAEPSPPSLSSPLIPPHAPPSTPPLKPPSPLQAFLAANPRTTPSPGGSQSRGSKEASPAVGFGKGADGAAQLPALPTPPSPPQMPMVVEQQQQPSHSTTASTGVEASRGTDGGEKADFATRARDVLATSSALIDRANALSAAGSPLRSLSRLPAAAGEGKKTNQAGDQGNQGKDTERKASPPRKVSPPKWSSAASRGTLVVEGDENRAIYRRLLERREAAAGSGGAIYENDSNTSGLSEQPQPTKPQPAQSPLFTYSGAAASPAGPKSPTTFSQRAEMVLASAAAAVDRATSAMQFGGSPHPNPSQSPSSTPKKFVSFSKPVDTPERESAITATATASVLGGAGSPETSPERPTSTRHPWPVSPTPSESRPLPAIPHLSSFTLSLSRLWRDLVQ